MYILFMLMKQNRFTLSIACNCRVNNITTQLHENAGMLWSMQREPSSEEIQDGVNFTISERLTKLENSVSQLLSTFDIQVRLLVLFYYYLINICFMLACWYLITAVLHCKTTDRHHRHAGLYSSPVGRVKPKQPSESELKLLERIQHNYFFQAVI